MARAFIDLHCHTSASFDSTAKPADVARAAHARGLTHLVVSDHDRIDGALAARDAAPAGLTVIVGEEVKTTDGDLICAYLRSAIPPGLSPEEAIAAAREQGGLVGIPHPFDRMRGSLLRDARMASLASLVDWVETYNARLIGNGNDARRRVRARARTARRGRLGRPLGARGRRRLHRARRRSVDAGRAARRARRAPSSSSAGPRTSSASGRRSRRASSGLRGNGRIRPGGHGERRCREDTHDERPRWAGPSSDGARRSTSR